MRQKNNAHPQKPEMSATDTGRNRTIFLSMTPRQKRVIYALGQTKEWIPREAVDRIAGTSNGPEVIRQLRCRLGYDAIKMERITTFDRDGLPTQPGRYRLTAKGRECFAEFIRCATDTGNPTGIASKKLRERLKKGGAV